MVWPLDESINENVSPSLTQFPVSTDPLPGSPASNNTPLTQICNPLYPGAFQFSVVLPTLAPAANVIGFGLAMKVSWPPLDAAVVCTVTVESGEPVAGWIRHDKLVKDTGKLGVKGDQTKATPEMGEIFINYKIKYAVDQIRQLLK
jgi:hypothetical protein